MNATQTMLIVWLVMVISKTTSTGSFTEIQKPDLVNLVARGFDKKTVIRDNVQRIENYFCRDHCGYTVPSFQTPLKDLVKKAHEKLVDPFFDQLGRCLQCSCGSDCHDIGNCCYPQINQPSTPQNIAFECVSTDMATRFGVPKLRIRGRWYHMIKQCSESIPSDQEIDVKCENPDLHFPDQVVPVTSLITGRNYLNRFCAICNDENEVESWHAGFELGLNLRPFVQTLQSPKDFLSFLLRNIEPSSETNIYFAPPDHLNGGTPNECYPLNKLYNTCSKNVTAIKHWDQLFVQACESNSDMQVALQMFQYDARYYKNVFCWLCHEPYSQETIEALNYTFDMQGSFSSLITLLSGSVVLNNDASGVLSSDDRNADGCTCREVFSPTEGLCRAVLCPVGEYYVVCDCIPFMHIAQFHVKIPLTVRLLHQNNSYLGVQYANTDNVTKLTETVASVLQDLASVEIKIIEFFNLYEVVSESDHYNVLLTFFEILDTTQISKIFDVFDEGIEVEVDDDKFEVVFEDKFEVKLETVFHFYLKAAVAMTKTFSSSHSITPLFRQNLVTGALARKVELAEPFRKLSFCKLVCIYSNESTYALYENGGNQEASAFVVECSSAEGLDYIRVCREDFVATGEENETKNQGQSVRGSLFIVSLSVIAEFLSTK